MGLVRTDRHKDGADPEFGRGPLVFYGDISTQVLLERFCEALGSNG